MKVTIEILGQKTEVDVGISLDDLTVLVRRIRDQSSAKPTETLEETINRLHEEIKDRGQDMFLSAFMQDDLAGPNERSMKWLNAALKLPYALKFPSNDRDLEEDKETFNVIEALVQCDILYRLTMKKYKKAPDILQKTVENCCNVIEESYNIKFSPEKRSNMLKDIKRILDAEEKTAPLMGCSNERIQKITKDIIANLQMYARAEVVVPKIIPNGVVRGGSPVHVLTGVHEFVEFLQKMFIAKIEHPEKNVNTLAEQYGLFTGTEGQKQRLAAHPEWRGGDYMQRAFALLRERAAYKTVGNWNGNRHAEIGYAFFVRELEDSGYSEVSRRLDEQLINRTNRGR